MVAVKTTGQILYTEVEVRAMALLDTIAILMVHLHTVLMTTK
jgi:hypothetical protein